MKKIISVLTGLFLIISCSSTNDNNSTIVAPVPPTNLKGSNTASSQISLTWTDNSTNETGFKIERKTSADIFTVIGTTTTDVTDFIDSNAINGISYTYRVYAFNSAGNSPTYSNEINITSYALPVLTTSPVNIISTNSISTGGNITDGSGLPVNSRGIVWNTLPNPTTSLSTKTIDGSGIGSYTSLITSLKPDTIYYIRAYATNSKGTAYGNEITQKTASIFTIGGGVTDICGNSYPTIILNGKEWMQKNLDVCKYRNGDIIPQEQDMLKWENLTTGAWCYYENKTENGVVYGKLYNGYALNDPRGIAPIGWHVSSSTEWDNLIVYLGGVSIDDIAVKLREKGTTHWVSSFPDSTNESGFTALPSGQVNYYGKPNMSSYYTGINYISSYWLIISKGPYYYISFGHKVGTGSSGSSYANNGHSIRCVKD